MQRFLLLSVLAFSCVADARANDVWHFKQELLPQLVKQVPNLLKSQDKKTGRFGEGIWIVTDQNLIYPLAVAWATADDRNSYYHSPEVLEAIIAGGDALIADQDARGMWVFRKKDGSTWGDIYMPWTYSRWVRAYALIRDAMPRDRREKWEKALQLGYDGIYRTQVTGKSKDEVQNIPAHHAMGLYLAGQLFDKPQWCDAAKAYMKRVVEAQSPDGWWSEHNGPVMNYGFVYVDAVGTYYGISHDETVLPALQRTAAFHAHFCYPDGTPVETVDERNPYERSIVVPNVGFTFSPLGRAFAHRQYEKKRGGMAADNMASYLLYGEEGPEAPLEREQPLFITQDRQAMTKRDGAWFSVLVSYHAQQSMARWIQDRQNFVSVFHDRTGLIVGGGNTKLQPLWSTFTVGETSLMKWQPGNENPNFRPPPGLVHIPREAALVPETTTVRLTYADLTPCTVSIKTRDATTAKLIYTAPPGKDVAAHVTLIPQMKEQWRTASGKGGSLAKPFELKPGEAGGWIEHHGWRLWLPPQASVTWPALPHNPYTKDGHAEMNEGRIVVTLPFDQKTDKYELTLEVPETRAR
jgi:hypothetical protein